jgi:ribosomal protein L29
MAKELKEKTEKELMKQLAEAREEIRKFRFSLSGAGQRDVKTVREMKKKVAQILTELKSRELNTEVK